MFRDNKREIFGFRKYKAYGLASAVIAAFFLMGGVASADEVTSATSSDTTAHVVTSPTEASANNATATPEANVATETPATVEANTTTETSAVASGDRSTTTDETASTTSPYVSGEAKQSVRDNLAPLAEVQTSGPTPDPKKPEIPSPRTPEPKKPETPQPEAPKPIETPKSNDSVVESSNQPQFVKDELPKTGETNSNLALVGVSLLTALGLIGFVKRKREE